MDIWNMLRVVTLISVVSTSVAMIVLNRRQSQRMIIEKQSPFLHTYCLSLVLGLKSSLEGRCYDVFGLDVSHTHLTNWLQLSTNESEVISATDQ